MLTTCQRRGPAVENDDESAADGEDNKLEVGKDEKGGGEGGEADGVAREVDVGK